MMTYQEILERIAKKHNTDSKEIETAMREALHLAGYDIEPAMFIAFATVKAEKDYIS